MEPTSADVEALARFVFTNGRLSFELAERQADLAALAQAVVTESGELGIDAPLPLLDRVHALALQWQLSGSFVATVRDSLVEGDGVGPLRSVPNVVIATRLAFDRRREVGLIEADLIAGGADEVMAKAIAVNAGRLWDANPTRPLHEVLTRAAADYAGVSVEEFQRRGGRSGCREVRRCRWWAPTSMTSRLGAMARTSPWPPCGRS